MISYYLVSIGMLLSGACGYLLGWRNREVAEFIKKFTEHQPETPPDPGVTYGAYRPAGYGPVNEGGETGIAEAKTPQRVSWEADQEIEKEARS